MADNRIGVARLDLPDFLPPRGAADPPEARGVRATWRTNPIPANLGAVVSVRGSVVDIRFDAHLPPIYSLLHAKEGKIAIEVLAQLDAQPCVESH